MFPVGFPYKRFSDPSQEAGDSIRRQNALSYAWSEKTGIPLDTTLTLEDKAVSGLRGISRTDPERYALAAFLKGIEMGRVQPGDYLLIENLDRLTREQEVPATHLLTSVLMAGVKVVQLSPYELELTDKSDGWTVMRAVMELSRGHGESRIKSVRVAAVKAEQRRQAANGLPVVSPKTGRVRHVLTRRLPAWMELGRDGRPRLIPERAAVVKRIFTLAAAGHGYALIVKRLTQEKVPAFCGRVEVRDDKGSPLLGRDGRPRAKAAPGQPLGSGRWTRSYVAAILSDRRALGELQPRLRDGTPEGDLVRIPAAVSEKEWLAARAGAAERQKRPGRLTPEHVNLFAHLIKDARTGSSYNSTLRRDGHRVTGHNFQKPPHRVLIPHEGTEGRAPIVSFPLGAFEEAILAKLDEIDPREVLDQDAPDETGQLAAQKAEVRGKIDKLLAALEAELDAGEEPSRGTQRLLKKLEDAEREIEQQLRKARQNAAHPLSESWGQAKTLIAVAADPDARLRLRSLLRQIVSEIRLLVVPRKRDRIAAVQVWFAGDEQHRDYLILHRPALVASGHRREGFSVARVLPPDLAGRTLDLRRREDAAALEVVLRDLDPATLIGEK
jgi:DNA invertase Pin-like site-specific DNA recombinase